MPYANPEDEKKWRENNRDWHKTPQQIKRRKQLTDKHRYEMIKNLPDKYEYKYNNDKKSKMKYHWIKKKGLRLSDFERTWDKYVNTSHCELCNISLKKVRKNMDHCHRSGYMRFIVCQRCNGFLRYRDKRLDSVHEEIK